MDKTITVKIAGKEVQLTNLNKTIWPGELTKAELIKYYHEIAPFIIPHIYNRPLVMKRYPDGINGETFYQKECPDYAPEWIKTVLVKHTEKTINYFVCNDEASLVWLANYGCIEMHPWLSRVENIDCPDIAVMDLDPAEGVSFNEVLKIALLVKEALMQFDLNGYPKTSGATGLHIFIPIKPIYSFNTVTKAMQYIAELIARINPKNATVERIVSRRGRKVYLDYLQNVRGKTMGFQYSLRALPGAPVSTPLYWEEVEMMKISPDTFTIHNILSRIKETGDIYHDVLSQKQTLDTLLDLI